MCLSPARSTPLLNCRDPNPPSMKKQYLSKRRENGGLSNSHTSVAVRARMGNQSTSKTSIPLSFSRVLPSEWSHYELLCNLICPKTILPTALGIWEQKNCQDRRRRRPLVAKETLSLFLSSLLHAQKQIWAYPSTSSNRRSYTVCNWSGVAASESGRICKGFTSDLEGLRLIAS